MTKIFAIAWKDTRLRFAGPAEWLFFLILPIIFTVVLAGGTGGSADDRVRLVVVDEAASPLSAQRLDALGRSATVRPDLLPRAEADSQFSQRRASAELVIPPEFDMAHLLQGPLQVELRQQPNNPSALVAYQAVTKEIDRIGSLASIAEASVVAAEQAQQAQAPERLTISRGTTADRIAYDPRANSSAGQLITWVFIPLLGISGMFAYERQRGTLRRLRTSPTRSATYRQGTVLGQVATALVQMLLLVGFGIVVMHLNWGQDPAALALILLATALAGAALGTMIGAFVRSEGQANGLSWLLGMLMALLGGCWYPAELFPPFVRTFSLVLPTTWAMQGMLNIVSRGLGLAGVLLPAMVLLGMAALYFFIGARRFRFE
jgi:ABC-2 type transport system permease protein